MRRVALALEDLSIQETKRSPLQCEVAKDTPLKVHGERAAEIQDGGHLRLGEARRPLSYGVLASTLMDGGLWAQSSSVAGGDSSRGDSLSKAVDEGSVRRLVWAEGPSICPPVPGNGLGAGDKG